MTVEMPGYVPLEETLAVEVGQRPDLDFVLEKLSSIQIEADVAGAGVVIDDGPEELAPLRRELPAGLYRIRVSRTGHRPIHREIRVEAGQQISLLVSLPPVPRRREVTIAADPDVSIAINGRPVGRGAIRRRLPVGTHHLSATAPGKLPFATDIVVHDHRDLDLRLDLSRERTPTQRAIFWGLAGGAAAMGVAGGTFGVLALNDHAELTAGIPSIALADRARGRAYLADALLGGAIVVGISAAIFHHATRPRPARAEPK